MANSRRPGEAAPAQTINLSQATDVGVHFFRAVAAAPAEPRSWGFAALGTEDPAHGAGNTLGQSWATGYHQPGEICHHF
jgi:hypothetical protein